MKTLRDRERPKFSYINNNTIKRTHNIYFVKNKSFIFSYYCVKTAEGGLSGGER